MQRIANRFPFLWPFKKFLNSQFSNSVLRQFHEEIKDETKKLIVVYDCKTVPPTIGDFSYVIVLLRYLILRKRRLTLIVINSEYREDWNSLTSHEVDNFLKELQEIVGTLVEEKSFNFLICAWTSDLETELNSENTSVLFSRNVFSRSSFYNLLPNLLNNLLKNTHSPFLKKLLFSKSDFPIIQKSLPARYVTLIVRSSSNWGEHRNTKLEDFFRSLVLISQQMPDFDIVVVSDESTCNYFREEIRHSNFTCSFSKDYSSSFLEDVAVIFRGSYCFQLNGGGICVYPIFSDMPYLFVMDPGNYDPWKAKSLTSFARPDQQFFGTMSKEVFFDNILRI